MNARPDIDRLVSDWLRAEATAAGSDRVLTAALIRVGIAGQAVVRPSRTPLGLHGPVMIALGGAALVIVAIIGIGLLPSNGGVGGGPAPTAPTTPTASPKSAQPTASAIPAGSFDIPWRRGTVHLTVPAGWSSIDGGTAVAYTPETGGNGPTLAVHDVARIAPDACRMDRDAPYQRFEAVGGTVNDLLAALADQGGTRVEGPVDASLGGYPAKKLSVTLAREVCGQGPEGRYLWQDVTGTAFGIFYGGSATIYVVDVDGDRLVITSRYRGSSIEEIAELERVVSSIEIVADIGMLQGGRHSRIVDGIPLSFVVPPLTADGWAWFDGISLNKSVAEGQAAEEMIYWTRFPRGTVADRCGQLAGLPDHASQADIAAAVSTAPGTELMAGPSDVSLGGRPAKHVVVRIRRDVGCDPGYFFSWHATYGGPLWTETTADDTVRVWIVDVAGTPLFIAAETHADAESGLSDQQEAGLEREVQQIVDSIQFE